MSKTNEQPDGHDTLAAPLKVLTDESIQKFNELVPAKAGAGAIEKKTLDTTIAEVVKYCQDFTIGAGIDAAEKLKLGKTVLAKVVKYRTGIENKRKDLNAPAVDYKKSIDGEAKRLQALLAPGEKVLAEKIATAENAAKKAKEDRAIERRTKMIETGFVFDGQLWVVGREMVMPSKIEDSTDEEFAVLIEAGKSEAERLLEEHTKQQEQLQQLQNLQDQQQGTQTVEAGVSVGAAFVAATETPVVKTGEQKELRWFTDRIGKNIMAHSADHYNGLMIVKDQSHAVKLAHFYQASQGYYFEEAPDETTAATPTTQTVKMKGYREGYEEAIADAMKVLADPEKMTRVTITERIGKLIDNVKGIVY